MPCTEIFRRSRISSHAEMCCLQTVERAFSLLKRRFRRVKLLNQKSHNKAVKVVMAACILHNICIKEQEDPDYYFQLPRINQVR